METTDPFQNLLARFATNVPGDWPPEWDVTDNELWNYCQRTPPWEVMRCDNDHCATSHIYMAHCVDDEGKYFKTVVIYKDQFKDPVFFYLDRHEVHSFAARMEGMAIGIEFMEHDDD